MERSELITQLRQACEYEDKFILGFDTFLTTHVSDNYHLSDAEKEFVDTKIKMLLNDSKRHLDIFKSILGETEADTSLTI